MKKAILAILVFCMIFTGVNLEVKPQIQETEQIVSDYSQINILSLLGQKRNELASQNTIAETNSLEEAEPELEEDDSEKLIKDLTEEISSEEKSTEEEPTETKTDETEYFVETWIQWDESWEADDTTEELEEETEEDGSWIRWLDEWDDEDYEAWEQWHEWIDEWDEEITDENSWEYWLEWLEDLEKEDQEKWSEWSKWLYEWDQEDNSEENWDKWLEAQEEWNNGDQAIWNEWSTWLDKEESTEDSENTWGNWIRWQDEWDDEEELEEEEEEEEDKEIDENSKKTWNQWVKWDEAWDKEDNSEDSWDSWIRWDDSWDDSSSEEEVKQETVETHWVNWIRWQDEWNDEITEKKTTHENSKSCIEILQKLVEDHEAETQKSGGKNEDTKTILENAIDYVKTSISHIKASIGHIKTSIISIEQRIFSTVNIIKALGVNLLEDLSPPEIKQDLELSKKSSTKNKKSSDEAQEEPEEEIETIDEETTDNEAQEEPEEEIEIVDEEIDDDEAQEEPEEETIDDETEVDEDLEDDEAQEEPEEEIEIVDEETTDDEAQEEPEEETIDDETEVDEDLEDDEAPDDVEESEPETEETEAEAFLKKIEADTNGFIEEMEIMQGEDQCLTILYEIFANEKYETHQDKLLAKISGKDDEEEEEIEEIPQLTIVNPKLVNATVTPTNPDTNSTLGVELEFNSDSEAEVTYQWQKQKNSKFSYKKKFLNKKLRSDFLKEFDRSDESYELNPEEVELDFNFSFNNYYYNKVFISKNGLLSFEELDDPLDFAENENLDFIAPIALKDSTLLNQDESSVTIQKFGESPERILAVEWDLEYKGLDDVKVQLQLHESDNSILIMYSKAPDDSDLNAFEIKMKEGLTSTLSLESSKALEKFMPMQIKASSSFSSGFQNITGATNSTIGPDITSLNYSYRVVVTNQSRTKDPPFTSQPVSILTEGISLIDLFGGGGIGGSSCATNMTSFSGSDWTIIEDLNFTVYPSNEPILSQTYDQTISDYITVKAPLSWTNLYLRNTPFKNVSETDKMLLEDTDLEVMGIPPPTDHIQDEFKYSCASTTDLSLTGNETYVDIEIFINFLANSPPGVYDTEVYYLFE